MGSTPRLESLGYVGWGWWWGYLTLIPSPSGEREAQTMRRLLGLADSKNRTLTVEWVGPIEKRA
jgi:hypothetical protein